MQNKNVNLGDGFVAKFNSTGSTLEYATYFGGSGDDCISSIAVDSKGDVFMTGSTSSQFLKTTTDAFQPIYSGYTLKPKLIAHLYGDAFVGELNPAGSALLYLSYLGGSNNDGGMAIAIDSGGNAYVTGFTDSTNFPLAGASLQTKFGGDGKFDTRLPYGDAFLTVVNPTGTALFYKQLFRGKFRRYRRRDCAGRVGRSLHYGRHGVDNIARNDGGRATGEVRRFGDREFVGPRRCVLCQLHGIFVERPGDYQGGQCRGGGPNDRGQHLGGG